MADAATLLIAKPRWWHSRRRRRSIVFLLTLLPVLYLSWRSHVFDERLPAWAFVIWLLALATEWLWFRFLDPAYPHHDLQDSRLQRGSTSIPREAWQGALVAAGVLGLIGLAICLA